MSKSREELSKLVEEATKKLKLVDDKWWAWHDRAMLYLKLEEFESALKDFANSIAAIQDGNQDEKGEDLVDCEVKVLMDRVSCYLKLGNTTKATNDLKYVVKTRPKNELAHYYLGTFLFESGSQESIECFNKAIDYSKGQLSVAYDERGLAYYELGDFKNAYGDFNLFIATNAKDPLGYLHRGRALEKLGKMEEAMKDYDASIKCDPHCVTSLNKRIIHYMKDDGKYAKKYTEALKDLATLMRIQKDDPTHYYRAAKCLQKLQKYEEALVKAEKAVRILGLDDSYSKMEFGAVIFLRGQIFLDLGKSGKARKDFELAKKMNKNLESQVEKAIAGLVKEVTEDDSKETSEDDSKEIAEDDSKETSEDDSKEIAEDDSKETSEDDSSKE